MTLATVAENPHATFQFVAAEDIGLTHQALAEALAEPGFNIADAKAFVRNMHIAGNVKHYARTRDSSSAYLYHPDAALALAVLRRASEAGFASPAVRLAIGKAAQKWRDEDLPGGLSRDDLPRSPGTWLLAMYGAGQRNYTLDLGFFRKPGQPAPIVGARFRQSLGEMTVGTNFPTETEYLEMRSSWTCFLDPVMAHLTRRKPLVN